ncbi:MAG: nucleoid-associated protein [Ruthenibacterium lactatiformans]
MNIELIKAILHVLDPAVDAPILSEAILPPSEDALQYLAGHAAKCFASDEAKACTLADDSAFLPLLWNIEDDFEKKTAVIAGDWFRVMQENPAIPAGDAAFLLLEIDGAEYLAALKLNYKPGWLHYCRMDGGPAVNEVVRQGTVLPGTSGKADEAFFVDQRTNAVRLLEKSTR